MLVNMSNFIKHQRFFISIACTPELPMSIENGNVKVFQSYPPSYTAYRTSFTYTCNGNYKLSTTSNEIVCGDDGWSSLVTQPRCLKGM